jgi:hypothetical protein
VPVTESTPRSGPRPTPENQRQTGAPPPFTARAESDAHAGQHPPVIQALFTTTRAEVPARASAPTRIQVLFTTNDASETPRDNQLFGTGNATGLCRPAESTARTPMKTLSFEMSTVLVVTSPTLITCSHSGAVVSR